METIPLPPNVTLPEGVSYDGALRAPRQGKTLLCFTDHAAGPAKGASFSVELQYLTTATLNRKLREVRQEFRIQHAVQPRPRPAMCGAGAQDTAPRHKALLEAHYNRLHAKQSKPVALEIPEMHK